MTTAKAELAKPAAKAEAKAEVKTLFVLDTTAVSGPRTHEQIIDGMVKSFTFEQGKALPLPKAVAIKFIRHDAFKLVDKDGNLIEFKRRPKQPDELGAGETLVLAQDETIARYDELSTPSLQARVLEMAGGERFAEAPVRGEMIAFIIEAKVKAAKANVSREADVGKDEFLPEPDLEDAA